MKIVNLNEYNEGDGLKNKLRRKIDQFEPELPDSLWDRIHHEMDQREDNRKRRTLWWFSSVAVIVLACGIVTFLMVEDYKTPVAQQPAIQTPANGGTYNDGGQAALPPAPGTIATTPALNENASIDANTHTPAHNTGGGNSNTTSGGNVTGGNPVEQTTTPANIVTNPPANPATGNGEVTEPGNTGKTEVAPNIQPGKTENTEQPVATADKKDEIEKEVILAAPARTIEVITNTAWKKWFIGAVFSYNQTYRTVSDVTDIATAPTATDRNRYEHKSYSPSYGIEFGFLPCKNFFIKSGVNMYNTSEIVKYDILRRIGANSGPPIIYGNFKDSVAVGNGRTAKNTYTYIQIPLEVGYTNTFNESWGYYVSGGAVYNMLNRYNYNYYEPFFGNTFIPVNQNGSKYVQGPQYQSYFMLSAGGGIHYNLAKNWRAAAGLTYRRAVTSSSTKESAVDVRPYSVGGTAGVYFTF